MQLGMIGLGRMGANIVRRLMREGHECVVYDHDPAVVETLQGEGATGVGSLNDLAAKITGPAGGVGHGPRWRRHHRRDRGAGSVLDSDDTVIDGGNTYYRDDLKHAQTLAQRGIRLPGLRHQRRRVGPRPRLLPDDRRRSRRRRPARPRSSRRWRPASRPPSAPPAATATPRRRRRATCTAGPPAPGHFVKMVHNGIEYGMMASFAEGLNILRNADIGSPHPDRRRRDRAAGQPRVLPLRHRRRRGRRGLAPRQRRRLLAARPHRRRAARLARPRRLRRPGLRLRRGPLDLHRRHRRGRPRPGASPPPCTRASARAASTTSPTRRSRRCASSSAAMRRRTKLDGSANGAGLAQGGFVSEAAPGRSAESSRMMSADRPHDDQGRSADVVLAFR